MISEEILIKLGNALLKTGIIVITGHFIAAYITKILKRTLDRSKLDKSLISLIANVANILLHVIVILTALSGLGISTSGILAALSAAALAIAVAVKDSLSNVAGGILLLISPRFSTGDYIESESDSGTVIKVDLLHTTINTPDNKQVSIPNGVLINSHIINYTTEKKRRVDIVFPIPYETNQEEAKKIIKDTILRHPLVINDPEEPFVRVQDYGDSAVNIVTRTWCNTDDYRELYFDITEQVRSELDKNGISMPYNQLDVKIRQ